MTTTNPAPARTVLLHPLHIGEIEDGVAEVGRPDTGVFVSLPEPGIEIIRDLRQGFTLDEVSQRFAQRHGQPPDLDDFLAALTECGFVRQPDGQQAGGPLADEPEAPGLRGWRLLGSLPSHRVAWLLSRPAMVVWVAVWLAVPGILIFRPDLIPTAADARLGLGVAPDALLLTVLAWSLVLVHEMAHLLAVRARGCAGVLRLSNRLHLLVAETDMSGIRSLPRSQRYAPYLAGMTFTMSAFAAVLIAQLAGMDARPLLAIGYLCLFTLLFELAFFLRTDIYYVITTSLRLGNLMTDTWRWVGNKLVTPLRRRPPYDLSAVPAREMRFVRWYSVFLVIGVAVVIGQFLLLGLPLLLSFLRDSISQIAAGPSTLGFWDAAVLLLLTAAHFGTLAVVSVLKRVRPVAGVRT
jgi:hypothetical protein